MIFLNGGKHSPKKGDKGWYIPSPFIIIGKEYAYDANLDYEGFVVKEITDKKGKKVPIIGLQIHDCSDLKCGEICKVCGKFHPHIWEELPADIKGVPKKCKKCGEIKYFHTHNFLHYNHKSFCTCGFMVDGEYGNKIGFEFSFLPNNWKELVEEAKKIKEIKALDTPTKSAYVKFWEGVYEKGWVDYYLIKTFFNVPKFDYYKIEFKEDNVVIIGANEAERSWSCEIEYLGTSYTEIGKIPLEEFKQKIKFLTEEDLQEELEKIKNKEVYHEEKMNEIEELRKGLESKTPKHLYDEFMVKDVIAWNDDPYEKHWGCHCLQIENFILMIEEWKNKFQETGEIEYYSFKIKKNIGIEIKEAK